MIYNKLREKDVLRGLNTLESTVARELMAREYGWKITYGDVPTIRKRVKRHAKWRKFLIYSRTIGEIITGALVVIMFLSIAFLMMFL